MIASTRELGIGGGILVARLGLDPEIGTDAMELLGLYDQAASELVRLRILLCAVLLVQWCHATRFFL